MNSAGKVCTGGETQDVSLLTPQPTSSREGRRITSVIGGLHVLFMVLLMFAATAPTAAAASSDLAVSFPAEPIPVEPGDTAKVTLSVADVGSEPLTVTITPSRVRLLDDGQTQFLPTPDPQFAHRIQIVPEEFELKAGQAKQVRIRIETPENLRPDDYYLGFLATPEVTSGQIRTVNAVGALVVLTVPGDRNTSVTATYVDVPTVSWSASVSGAVRVTNTGKNSLRFTTETVVNGFSKPDPSRIRERAHQLPAGRSRGVPIQWKSTLGIGKYDIQTVVLYNKSSQSNEKVVLTRTVYVIAPYWLAVPAGIVALIVFLLVRRSRKQRRRRQEVIYGAAANK